MCGQKEILLFGPEETKFLYQKEGSNSEDQFSNRFSTIDPNLSPKSFRKAYPKTSNTLATRIILNPGDVLFVPKLWWHLVSSYPDSNRGINIMANMFFELSDVN
jgi:HSPB1-associated protein 1